MNDRSDIERVLGYWMEDGPVAMPDRVIDVVARRISVRPQRRSWRLLRRSSMSPIVKWGAAAAAVLVVAVVGYNLLPGRTGPGTPTSAPTPSAQPTAGVTAAPSASAACPQWYTGGCGDGAGILPPGIQTTQRFFPGTTLTVPEGWVNDGDAAAFYGLFPDSPANQAEFARSDGLAQSIHMGPNQSPYFVCDALENNSGTTAAEIVAAVVANKALATTGLADVAIGGLTGKQFDVGLDPAWTEPCPDDPPGSDLYTGRTRVLLLDAPGRGVLLILVGSLHAVDFEAFLAEAMPIVESFKFNLGQ